MEGEDETSSCASREILCRTRPGGQPLGVEVGILAGPPVGAAVGLREGLGVGSGVGARGVTELGGWFEVCSTFFPFRLDTPMPTAALMMMINTIETAR